MEEQQQRNPFLEQEDYFKPYQQNIENLKNNPEVIAFDKLCYEVFEASEMGRKFIEFAKERFLIYSQISRGDANYDRLCLWQEGFRDAHRMILQSIMSHKQRIAAGTK